MKDESVRCGPQPGKRAVDLIGLYCMILIGYI